VATLFWEFHGPDAKGTAEHFRVHLDGFLGVNGLGGCATRVESPAQGAAAVVACESPAEWVDVITKSLKPKRVEG
jgi:uncharacterized protein